MSTADWPRRYAELAERLPELARRARPVLCGLGACVDVYLRLEEVVRLLTADANTPPTAFRELLLELARRGVGGEIRVDWPDGPAWRGCRPIGSRAPRWRT